MLLEITFLSNRVSQYQCIINVHEKKSLYPATLIM